MDNLIKSGLLDMLIPLFGGIMVIYYALRADSIKRTEKNEKAVDRFAKHKTLRLVLGSLLVAVSGFRIVMLYI